MKLPAKRPLVIGCIILLAIIGLTVFFFYMGRMGTLPEGLIQANGRIEGDHVTVSSKFAGRVKSLLVREGDAVQTGQVLLEIDDSQMKARTDEANQGVAALAAQTEAARTALTVLKKEVPLAIDTAEASIRHARAVLAKAEAAEDQAHRDAQRFRDLAEKGSVDKRRSEQMDLAWIVAQNELASARTGLTQAENQLAQARFGEDRVRARESELAASLAQLARGKASLAEAQSVLTDLTIKAPTSGILITRIVDVGEVVTAGSPLLELVDLDDLYLKVYVPEPQIGKIRLGLPARIYTDAFPKDYSEATVKYISSRAEFTPKEVQTSDERVKLTYAIKLYLNANPDHRITPGMPADAVIQWQKDAPWARPR